MRNSFFLHLLESTLSDYPSNPYTVHVYTDITLTHCSLIALTVMGFNTADSQDNFPFSKVTQGSSDKGLVHDLLTY